MEDLEAKLAAYSQQLEQVSILQLMDECTIFFKIALPQHCLPTLFKNIARVLK